MKYAFKIFISILLAGQVYAQEISLGLLFKTDKAYEGYTLFWPNSSRTTYLIDNCGFKVHEWEGEGFPEIMNYLLEDGSLLRMSAGFIEKLDGTANNFGAIRLKNWVRIITILSHCPMAMFW